MTTEKNASKNSKTGGIGSGSDRDFAGTDKSKRRDIASQGGKAAHEQGSAHEFDSEEAREAGKKGGQAHGSQGSGDANSRGSSSSIGSSSSGQQSTGNSQGNKSSEGPSSSSRGGTHEQHVNAGQQSHKNR